jgi:hypothetical protein
LIQRYWTLWHTLPADERRARAGRVLQRLFCRRPVLRRVARLADPRGSLSLARVLTVRPAELLAALREVDPRRGPLCADLELRAAAVAALYPEHARTVLAASERIACGRFDLLGSGEHDLSRSDGGLDWHRDWKTGRSWPQDTYYSDVLAVRGDGSDVKLPWELSRCQHLLVLGQAYRLAPHVADDGVARARRGTWAAIARSHIDDWIRSNPRGMGVNWCCTMEVALRAVTWLATLGLFRGASEFDDAFLGRMLASLWAHGRHIRQNLETGAHGVTANHYLSDLLGLLAIASGLPELREAGGWERFARGAIEREMASQVHPDGADFERSIPYHRFVAEMFLHAALLAESRGRGFSPEFRERLARMLEFTATVLRPDHSVAQWGDGDDGRFLPLDGYATREPHDHRHLLVLGGRFLGRDDLIAAGAGAGVEATWLLGPAPAEPAGPAAGRVSRAFPDVGYHVMRGRDLHAGFSSGRVGSRGMGSHSHNDLLSLVVWAGGVDWITDPGTGIYTSDPGLRNRLRATAAHATLQLGEREQNDLGSGSDGLFSMHERSEPRVLRWEARAAQATLVAQHRGFSRGAECWVHERQVDFDEHERLFVLRDRLEHERGGGAPRECARLRFPLGPRVAAEITNTAPAALLQRIGAAWGAGSPAGPRTVRTLRLTSGPACTLWLGLDLPSGSEVGLGCGVFSPRYGVVGEHVVVTATLPPSPRTVTLSLLWNPAVGR